jgi:hypothetical protein
MEEMRNAYKIMVGNPEGKTPLGRPRHRWILGNCNWKVWIGFIWLRIRTGGGLL